MLNVYIDVNNLYYNTNQVCNKKIDYNKYLDFINDFGTVNIKKAYCVNNPSFAYSLKCLGFDVNYKPPRQHNQNALMTFDILRDISEDAPCDKIVLGTNSQELNFLIKHLRDMGKIVYVLASNLKKIDGYDFEIPPSLLL